MLSDTCAGQMRVAIHDVLFLRMLCCRSAVAREGFFLPVDFGQC